MVIAIKEILTEIEASDKMSPRVKNMLEIMENLTEYFTNYNLVKSGCLVSEIRELEEQIARLNESKISSKGSRKLEHNLAIRLARFSGTIISLNAPKIASDKSNLLISEEHAYLTGEARVLAEVLALDPKTRDFMLEYNEVYEDAYANNSVLGFKNFYELNKYLTMCKTRPNTDKHVVSPEALIKLQGKLSLLIADLKTYTK